MDGNSSRSGAPWPAPHADQGPAAAAAGAPSLPRLSTPAPQSAGRPVSVPSQQPTVVAGLQPPPTGSVSPRRAEQVRRRRRSRRLRTAVCLILVLGLGAAGAAWWSHRSADPVGASDATIAGGSTGSSPPSFTIEPQTTVVAGEISVLPTSTGGQVVTVGRASVTLATTSEILDPWTGRPGVTNGGAQFQVGPGGGAIFVLWGDYVVVGHEKEIVEELAVSPGFDSKVTVTSWEPRASKQGFVVDVEYTQPTDWGKNTSYTSRMLTLVTADVIIAIKYDATGDVDLVNRVFSSITLDGAPIL